ncbi:glycoside hydrolase family 78 protein [Chitinophaga sedimenti]|uniref:alpha-L-rhamnosidase n=1 Tax=Chitinophaga sedimenti TaxID=2033606 RepID=UPI0020032338|nr:alpha-L-rhamnosidase [Chitinophaga sedimenti]MCK7553738.1 glycoside hydrolase family 78 protein [Chitinophaga sedimenti]
MKLKTFALHLLLINSPILATAQTSIGGLKTEYAVTPLGIDIPAPRFSWKMNATQRGAAQQSYQLIVKDEKGMEVWNSGKVNTSNSLNIIYQGKKLSPQTRYSWSLAVWDQTKRKLTADSWFETGLMTGKAAWNNAQWIGGDDNDLPFYSDYLPVFKISYSIQFDENSTRAGFVYGANDPRLMDRHKNIYHLENARDSSYILAELDISKMPALLNIYRVGYAPADKRDVPLKSFPIPQAIINERNCRDKHSVHISSVMGNTKFYINEHLVGQAGMNPLGQGGDYIAFPLVANIGFRVPEKQLVHWSDIKVCNYRNPSNTLRTLPNVTTTAGFRVSDPSRNAMPMLRTVFTARQAPIAKARLYVTARGIYDLYVNGHRIGNDYFNPGCTQYNLTQLYQTFDVTKEIKQGKNAIGAILGEGWWSGGSTYMGEAWNVFGDRQSLLAKLVITHTDGKEEVIVTDPASWRYFNDGPTVYSSFFQGEVYDASKEAAVQDWSTAGYNDSHWHQSVTVSTDGHVNNDPKSNAPDMPLANNFDHLDIVGQFGDAVREIAELNATSVTETRPGVFVYDMGQNIAGVPHITLDNLKAGKEIKLRFAEVTYPDLPEYKGHVGMIMLENIRAAMAQDIYITRGGKEAITPRFTYHGFRYIEVTGIEKALPLSAIKARVLSSIHQSTAGYSTSNPDVNKLWNNINWSARGNFISIPTDCPQRNERLGWSGDISVFSETATYLADLPLFLKRHMRAMRDVQRADGCFSDVAPIGGGFGGVLWGSAGITVAWQSYLQYGDESLLQEHYTAMKRYITFLRTRIDSTTHVLDDKDRKNWGSLGDWLSPEYDRTEKSLLWEAYFVYDLDVMRKIALILQKKEDAASFEKLYAERKAFFNKTYIDNGKTAFRGKLIDNQASYAVPLALNVFTDPQQAAANLATTVIRTNKSDDGRELPAYSLMTGFIGTAAILPALSDQAVAYKLLQQTSYPSWLYPVKQGATTIWERLNSYTHTDGFGGNNNMNSFNHYSFGAVGAWMLGRSLGIARDEQSPGFKHFVLCPEPDPTKSITHAEGFYESMYGRIESSWKITGTTINYRVVIPANTSANLLIRANNIREKGQSLADVKGVKYIGQRGDKQVFELPAGVYELEAQ